jgi:hypothetical protein
MIARQGPTRIITRKRISRHDPFAPEPLVA